MASNLYKVYPASEYGNLDLSLFQENIRWNIAGTEFIVEFINPPHGNTITLTQPEARALMLTPEWLPVVDENGFPI